MMRDVYFYDVPVYRVAEDDYYRARDEFVEKTMYPGPTNHNEALRDLRKERSAQEAFMKEHCSNVYGGQWKFNEIIGYIRLHFCGTQIRGEWYRVKAKRIVRTRRKIFEWHDWKLALEIDVPSHADDKQIFELIMKYLRNCNTELQEKRFIDTSLLETIGPHVRWRDIMRNGA